MLTVLSFIFACQDKNEPATCDYNENNYAVGDSFDAGDGCNSCSCDEYNGETLVTCTEMDCSSIESSACADLSINDCEETDSCTVIYASKLALDTEDECFAWANSVETVGCMNVDLGCGQAFSYAAPTVDVSNCYGFSYTCIPQDWGYCGQGTYPECE